jgi:hypothetical protein
MTSPDPYKRAMRPSALTAPHPLSPELFHTLLRRRDELKMPPFIASGASPLRQPSVADEHLPSTASTGSSSPSIPSELRRAPAPACRRGAAAPSVRGPPHHGLDPQNFLLKIKSGNRLFLEFCKGAPRFLPN